MARSYEGIKPIVGLPLERATSYSEIVMTWLISLAQQGWAFIDPHYRRTDLTRNLYSYHLLDNPKFTHIVMLDMDHRHPPDIVAKLCKSVAEDPGRAVVSALTYRRGVPYEPIAWRQGDEGRFHAVTEWQPGEVFDVDQVSPACTIDVIRMPTGRSHTMPVWPRCRGFLAFCPRRTFLSGVGGLIEIERSR